MCGMVEPKLKNIESSESTAHDEMNEVSTNA